MRLCLLLLVASLESTTGALLDAEHAPAPPSLSPSDEPASEPAQRVVIISPRHNEEVALSLDFPRSSFGLHGIARDDRVACGAQVPLKFYVEIRTFGIVNHCAPLLQLWVGGDVPVFQTNLTSLTGENLIGLNLRMRMTARAELHAHIFEQAPGCGRQFGGAHPIRQPSETWRESAGRWAWVCCVLVRWCRDGAYAQMLFRLRRLPPTESSQPRQRALGQSWLGRPADAHVYAMARTSKMRAATVPRLCV